MSEMETKRNATIILIVVAVIAIGISTGSHEGATAQTGTSNMTDQHDDEWT
jgi:hypothetical protein